MATTGRDLPGAGHIWAPAATLSPRIKRLRDEFWSFYERAYRNEVQAYTTGQPWDQVYSLWNWSNVPEMYLFFAGAKSYLRASAAEVPLPPGFWDEPLIVRRAIFFREVVAKHLPVQILEGELIVGFHFSTALSRSLTQAEAKEQEKAEKQFFAAANRLNRLGVGNCGAIPGHLVPNYPKVLRLGWRGLQTEAQAVADNPAATAGQRDLARAIVICADGVKALAERYAAEAERLAGDATLSPERQAELWEMAHLCRKVPWEPAATFPEALQTLWFSHMLLMAAESYSYPGPGVSPGRIDQYLYPYYRADLDAGRLTREQAREWLECWWIKHNYAYDFQGRVGTNQGINSSFGQLITLGGLDAKGNDAANDLTYLCLDVIQDLNLLEPKPNVRLHAKSPDKLLDRLTEMVTTAQGSPFLLNFDEKAMAGLRWEGLPEGRLWDYAPVGCLENTLQGDDRSGTVDVNLNIAKAVELALNERAATKGLTALSPLLMTLKLRSSGCWCRSKVVIPSQATCAIYMAW
jgi:pyruvate-formate lyase